MSEIKITDVVTKMVETLTPLSSEERLRAVRATMTLLGEEPVKTTAGSNTNEQSTEGPSSFPARVRVWMSQNGISAGELEHVAAFVATGDSSFTDNAARELCRSAGCLNAANHALYKGWTLTAPGLKRGAVLIKEISKVGQ